MQKMSSDLFHFGSSTWLILVDWFSNFSFAKKLDRTGGTDKVIKKLKKIFFQHGFCEQLRKDCGPEYRQSFQKWCRRAGLTYVTLLPKTVPEMLGRKRKFKMSRTYSGNAKMQVKIFKRLTQNGGTAQLCRDLPQLNCSTNAT